MEISNYCVNLYIQKGAARMHTNEEDNSYLPEDKLGDILPMEGYDKPVRYARVILFVLAAMELIAMLAVNVVNEQVRVVVICVYIMLAIVFAALGFYTHKKPYTAIILGLCLYGALVIVGIILNPVTALSGWIIKIIVFAFLIAALKNAREVQRWKEARQKE